MATHTKITENSGRVTEWMSDDPYLAGVRETPTTIKVSRYGCIGGGIFERPDRSRADTRVIQKKTSQTTTNAKPVVFLRRFAWNLWVCQTTAANSRYCVNFATPFCSPPKPGAVS